MNKQKFFDVVARHLLSQQAVCHQSGVCRMKYEGRKCAIGATIPESYYRASLDEGLGLGIPAIFISPEFHELREYWEKEYEIHGTPYDEDFMITLQRIHDVEDPKMWHKRLWEVAHCYDLTFEF